MSIRCSHQSPIKDENGDVIGKSYCSNRFDDCYQTLCLVHRNDDFYIELEGLRAFCRRCRISR